MADTKQESIGHLQKGSYIVIEGVACRVAETQLSRPGKHGHSKIRLTATGILDDKKRVIVMPGHDMVEVPIIEKRSAQVLAVHDDIANVMDSETYENFDLKIPEELKGEVVEGCSVMYWEIIKDRVMKQIKTQ